MGEFLFVMYTQELTL